MRACREAHGSDADRDRSGHGAALVYGRRRPWTAPFASGQVRIGELLSRGVEQERQRGRTRSPAARRSSFRAASPSPRPGCCSTRLDCPRRSPQQGRNTSVWSLSLDFAWPAQRLIVEIDGREWHTGRDAFQRDRRRQNALIDAGWRVIRFTVDDVRLFPDYVIAEILWALVPLNCRRDSNRPRRVVATRRDLGVGTGSRCRFDGQVPLSGCWVILARAPSSRSARCCGWPGTCRLFRDRAGGGVLGVGERGRKQRGLRAAAAGLQPLLGRQPQGRA